MAQQYTFFYDNVSAGQSSILNIQNEANLFGMGVSPDISAGIVTATTFVGDGSGLTGIVGSGSGVVIKDDNVLVGTATAINFGSNLSVSPISAGVVTVTSSGSGSGIGPNDNINTTGIITASAFYGVGLPQNLRTNSYVLTASDAGKHVAISTGGVTLNASTFDVGDVVTIYNDSEYAQSISVGTGVTMRRVSIGDTANSRGLNGYGLATILCISPNYYIISGAGVT